jgi:hypothetical protein
MWYPVEPVLSSASHSYCLRDERRPVVPRCCADEQDAIRHGHDAVAAVLLAHGAVRHLTVVVRRACAAGDLEVTMRSSATRFGVCVSWWVCRSLPPGVAPLCRSCAMQWRTGACDCRTSIRTVAHVSGALCASCLRPGCVGVNAAPCWCVWWCQRCTSRPLRAMHTSLSTCCGRVRRCTPRTRSDTPPSMYARVSAFGVVCVCALCAQFTRPCGVVDARMLCVVWYGVAWG